MARITIKDIAKECGVSITAVSFVLNGKTDSVSKETRQRVLDVCNKYHYHPNYIASALKSKLTHTAAVLVPDIENGYYARLIKSLESSFVKNGYSLFIANSGYDIELFKKTIADMIIKNIDFFIVVPPSSFSNNQLLDIKSLEKDVDVPVVILDRKIDIENAPIVINDDIKGGYLATKYLLEKGHKKIACITGPKEISSSQDRLLGYKKALSEWGVEFDDSIVYEGDYHFDGAFPLAKEILKDNSITAIFAFNDLMAYSIYKSASEMNKVVGKDISVVGFDDNQFSSLITPGLTTIKQNIDSLCSSVINELFNNQKIKKTILIEPDLVERRSVSDVNN